MLGNKLTLKQLIIILSLLFVVLIYLYYMLFWTTYQKKLLQYSDIDLQSQIEVERIKAASLANMRNEIASADDEYNGQIAVYDNQSNEIRVLNVILEGRADDINITWSDPVLDGSLVRRQAQIEFCVHTYNEASDIISDISNCQYRLIINNLSVEGEEGITEVPGSEDEMITAELNDISVSLTVTFYETTVGADSTEGLTVETTPAATEDSIVDYDINY